jgi:thiol:disulfide interchange protein DsbD
MRRYGPGLAGLAALLCATGFSLTAPAPAHAAESAPVVSSRATVTLVSDTDAVAPGTPLHVALRLRLAPGWHTYWHNPGDAGAPPELTLNLPADAKAGEIIWPTPARQPEGSLMTFGYSGEVLLPVRIAPGAGPLPVHAHATWLVCQKICVPEEGEFRLDLPSGTPSPSAEAKLFAAAAARTPHPSPWNVQIAPDGTLSVADSAISRGAVRDAWFIPATPDTIAAAPEQELTVVPGGFTLALKPGQAFHPGAALDGVLVVRDGGGQESAFSVSASPAAALDGPLGASILPFWRVLVLAFLGGAILNLMPCVFPVLAIKAVNLARLSGKERAHAGAHAASYTAGVMATFVAAGGALLALRATGAAAGWGFQFQSPAFVAFMAWVLFLVGLNLSGVFAVATPWGAGEKLASRGGHVGSFFTGMLAVVVATPCTAPFMGVAIAAGLGAPPSMTLAVFAVMGLGLAAPYVLLATIPAFARALPRPGRWMDVLKQALAFPMYAAAAWLVWVLSQEAGPPGVLAAAAGLVLLGFAAWAMGISQTTDGQGRRMAHAAAAAAGLGALAVLTGITALPAYSGQARSEAGVEAFSPARLSALLEEGRPVFVNMTAAWCVTCLVNERAALALPAVRREFLERNVAYLKGDWTRQDPAITAFLRSHGRDGVPLYVLFPGKQRAPVLLPQILTEGAVLRALEQTGA